MLIRRYIFLKYIKIFVEPHLGPLYMQVILPDVTVLKGHVSLRGWLPGNQHCFLGSYGRMTPGGNIRRSISVREGSVFCQRVVFLLQRTRDILGRRFWLGEQAEGSRESCGELWGWVWGGGGDSLAWRSS